MCASPRFQTVKILRKDHYDVAVGRKRGFIKNGEVLERLELPLEDCVRFGDLLVDKCKLELVNEIVGFAFREKTNFIVKLLEMCSDLFEVINIFRFHTDYEGQARLKSM